MEGITPMPGAQESERLLRTDDVMALTGLGYEHVKALMRVYGVRFGKRFYIKREWLQEGLEQMRRMKA